MPLLETNYLSPSPTFLVALLAYVVLVVVWPLWEALRAGRPIWALVIVLLSPVGGIAWFVIGRRDRRRVA